MGGLGSGATADACGGATNFQQDAAGAKIKAKVIDQLGCDVGAAIQSACYDNTKCRAAQLTTTARTCAKARRTRRRRGLQTTNSIVTTGYTATYNSAVTDQDTLDWITAVTTGDT